MARTWMQRFISKRLWFLLFNILGIGMLVLTNRLKPNASSMVESGVALAFVNLAALISAHKYQDWK